MQLIMYVKNENLICSKYMFVCRNGRNRDLINEYRECSPYIVILIFHIPNNLETSSSANDYGRSLY